MSTVEQLYQKMYECYDEIIALSKSCNSKLTFPAFKFRLENVNGVNVRSVFRRNKKFIYSFNALRCFPPVTFKEIFNVAKPYLDNYVEEYKNFKILNKTITNSIFTMKIYYEKYPSVFCFNPDCKTIYEIEIAENKIIYESKNSAIEEDNEKIFSFSVSIEIKLFNHKLFFQYDGKKDPIITNVCILCKRNKPNVLISKCFHLVVCNDCVLSQYVIICPYCGNKPVAGIHRFRFVISEK